MDAIAIILKALEEIERSDNPVERAIAYSLRNEIAWQVEQARKADWVERHKQPEPPIIP